MDRSLNEAARDIGQSMQQLRETMRDKGYPEASAHVSIDGPETFAIWLHAGNKHAFPGPVGAGYGRVCDGRTVGEAYAAADAAIASMRDRAERAAS